MLLKKPRCKSDLIEFISQIFRAKVWKILILSSGFCCWKFKQFANNCVWKEKSVELSMCPHLCCQWGRLHKSAWNEAFLCMQKILKKSDICMLDVHPFSQRRPQAWDWIIKFIRLGGELVVNLCSTHLYCLIHSLSISNKKKREKCEERNEEEDLE